MKLPTLLLLASLTTSLVAQVAIDIAPQQTNGGGTELVALSNQVPDQKPLIPASEPIQASQESPVAPIGREHVPPTLELKPVNETHRNRGTLLIKVPHDEVEVYVNGHPVRPTNSSAIVLNNLRPGLYEVRSECDGKTNIEMTTVTAGEVFEVDLGRVHDRNYFTITPSWSVLLSDAPASVGPAIDLGWIYNDNIYFGLDWNIHPELFNGNFVMGGMFKVMWYQPIAPIAAFGIGLSTGFIYHDWDNDDYYNNNYYDEYGNYIYDYDYNENYYFGGATTQFTIGRNVINCRISYDLLFADADENDKNALNLGHMIKLGLMIKL